MYLSDDEEKFLDFFLPFQGVRQKKKESKYPRIEDERTPEKHEGRRERAKGKLER